ncbi:MAG: hypothetical protein RLZZ507_4389 [Cyanobacteriota bacterium]
MAIFSTSSDLVSPIPLVGFSLNKVSGGSTVCRKAIWQWVFAAVEPKRRRTNLLVKELGEWLDQEKSTGKPVTLVRSRTAVKAVKLLFKKLVNLLD